MTWSSGDVLTAAQLNTYLPQGWTSYTPTLGGTGTTQGNSARTGGYIQYGKTVHFWARATRGSTTVIGSGLSLSLPVVAAGTAQHAGLYGKYEDAGSNFYLALPFLGTTSTINLAVIGTNGAAVAVGPTVPFTWATGDVIIAGGTYEAA